MSLPTTRISLGDHCAPAILLKELGLRTHSFPFDWVTFAEPLHDTNLMYNASIINQLLQTRDPSLIANEFIGDALETSARKNTQTTLWFPHESGSNAEIRAKYERRFQRLYETITTQPVLFILVTRHRIISSPEMDAIMNILMPTYAGHKILLISGSDHPHLADERYKELVIFKHIPYDITQYYHYDYSHFRPAMKRYLAELLSNP
jgi:hypothetical protein